MKRLIALSLLLTCCNACQGYPWAFAFQSKPVQHGVEEVTEQAVEGAAGLAGQDVHVEVDIDPTGDPSCMHCSLHCPKE